MEKSKIFMVYDDVIKSPHIFILKIVCEEIFRNRLGDSIDYFKFDHLDDRNLLRFTLTRTKKNILEYIGNKDISYYDNLVESIKETFDDYYTSAPVLDMGHQVSAFSRGDFVSDVYIYTPEYDKRIELDLDISFPGIQNIRYVHGDLETVLRSIPKVNLYISDDLEIVNVLKKNNLLYKKEILIANYAWNFIDDNSSDELKYKYDFIEDQKKYDFKYAFFNPLTMDESFFTQLPE